jgi:hypothetical protein
MNYVLFFKTEDMQNKRYYYTKFFNTRNEALIEEARLVNCGYNEKKVIYTKIKKGHI